MLTVFYCIVPVRTGQYDHPYISSFHFHLITFYDRRYIFAFFLLVPSQSFFKAMFMTIHVSLH